MAIVGRHSIHRYGGDLLKDFLKQAFAQTTITMSISEVSQHLHSRECIGGDVHVAWYVDCDALNAKLYFF